MTTTDLAAALIAGVQRKDVYDIQDQEEWGRQAWLHETEVLAALSTALDGVDERVLKIIEDWEHQARERDARDPTAEQIMREAQDLRALLAQNAALRAERDALAAEVKQADTMLVAEANASLERLARAEAAEAKVAALVGALRDIDALDPEVAHIGACSENAIRGLVLRMGERARAALSATATTEEGHA